MAATRWPQPVSEACLRRGRLPQHLQYLRDCVDTDLIGVGLAGTLLLVAAGQSDGTHHRGLLVLFPFLGMDAPPYGHAGRSTQACDVLLYLGGTALGRKLLSKVSLHADPMGLQGVYPGGSVSWAHAAECMVATDFVSLVVPPAAPVTVVLNRGAPALDESRAETLMSAMNQHMTVGFAAPDQDDLPERVKHWRSTGSWRREPESVDG